jgi:hypothetical protein
MSEDDYERLARIKRRWLLMERLQPWMDESPALRENVVAELEETRRLVRGEEDDLHRALGAALDALEALPGVDERAFSSQAAEDIRTLVEMLESEDESA